VRRIARTSACPHRQDKDRNGQQFPGRQQATRPYLQSGEFAAVVCAMRGIRDRHVDHPIQGESGCGRCLQQKLAEAGQLWTKNLNLGLTTRMNEALIGFVFASADSVGACALRPLADVPTWRAAGSTSMADISADMSALALWSAFCQFQAANRPSSIAGCRI